MRTTLDIDAPILKDLKRLQKREGKSLGRLVSDLLAVALASTNPDRPRAFMWHTQAMRARVDLADKQAILDAMDERRR
jgi:hypothetical protein